MEICLGGPSRGLKTAPGLFLGGDLDGDWMLHVRSDLLDITWPNESVVSCGYFLY